MLQYVNNATTSRLSGVLMIFSFLMLFFPSYLVKTYNNLTCFVFKQSNSSQAIYNFVDISVHLLEMGYLQTLFCTTTLTVYAAVYAYIHLTYQYCCGNHIYFVDGAVVARQFKHFTKFEMCQPKTKTKNKISKMN